MTKLPFLQRSSLLLHFTPLLIRYRSCGTVYSSHLQGSSSPNVFCNIHKHTHTHTHTSIVILCLLVKNLVFVMYMLCVLCEVGADIFFYIISTTSCFKCSDCVVSVPLIEIVHLLYSQNKKNLFIGDTLNTCS